MRREGLRRKEEEARLEEIAVAKIKEHLCGVNGFFRALWAWPNRIGYDDAHSIAVGVLIDAGADHLTAKEIADRLALSFAQWTKQGPPAHKMPK